MFARYFVELRLPFEPVERALLASPEDWMPGLARDAQLESDRLLAEVGFGSEGRRVEKLVEISLGQPLRMNSKAVVPMTWKPAGAEALVPTIEADIEVAALGPSRTQLSMNARYRPPLGLLGRALDRALLHRVAEATVRDFVERVGETLRATVATSGNSEHAAGGGVGTRGPEVRA